MKKIALTSLLAVFAVSGAHAANVIDGNPLYLPGAGHFYSVSSLGSHSGHEDIKSWYLNEEFGYGITNKLAVHVSTTLEDEQSFDRWGWGDLSLGAAYRVLDKGAWKADLVGEYMVDHVWGDHEPFLDKDFTVYTWAAGVRGGYVAHNWTLAGHAIFTYRNTESFNWNEDAGKYGEHKLALGLDGQYVIDSHWSALAGVEYVGRLDKTEHGIPGTEVKNAGTWEAMLGLNYNIDATKFVGAYISGDMNHHGGTAGDEWEVENGFGFGAKFGIDF